MNAFRRVLDRTTPLEHGGLHRREQPRGRANLVGRHPRDRRRPFGSFRLAVARAAHVLGEAVESGRVRGDEVSFTAGGTPYMARIAGNAMVGTSKGATDTPWRATKSTK